MNNSTEQPAGTAVYRYQALAILTLIYTCANVDRTVLSVVLEPIKREFALSDSQLGLLSGMAFAVTFVLMALPLGFLIDRVHRVRLLAVLLSIWSALTILCATANSYVTLVLLRMGVGAAESGASPTCMSLLSDIFPPRQRATAIGIFASSSALGVLLSFGLGGWLAQHYGWRSVLLMSGIPGFALMLIMLLCIREPRRNQPEASQPETPTVREVARFITTQFTLLHVIAAITLAACVNAGIVSWLASFFLRVHGLEMKQAGMMVALCLGIFGGTGTIIGGWLSDRVAARRGEQWRALIPGLAMTLSLPFGLVFLMSNTLSVALPALALLGFSMVFYLGPAFALVMSLIPPRMRGMTAALLQLTCNLVGTGLGPGLIGLLSDRLGGGTQLRYAMAAILLLAFWSAWHFFKAARSLKNSADEVGKTPESTKHAEVAPLNPEMKRSSPSL